MTKDNDPDKEVRFAKKCGEAVERAEKILDLLSSMKTEKFVTAEGIEIDLTPAERQEWSNMLFNMLFSMDDTPHQVH